MLQAAKTFLLASKRCDDELAQLKKAAQEQALATAEVEKERQWLEKQKTLIAIPAPEVHAPHFQSHSRHKFG